MKAIFIVAVSILFFSVSALSQLTSNDMETPDTLALGITALSTNHSKAMVIIEAWVYSDETILSFTAGFKWNDPEMHLDSARPSALFPPSDYSLFFYKNDQIDSSNRNQTFVLGGISFSSGLAGDSFTRRLWATYYFTIENWEEGDSVRIDILPGAEVEFEFATPGPFYPLGFQPYFEGPVLFPGIVTSIEGNDITLPSNIALYQNYPNPFNPETTIGFQISRRCQVELEIYNSIGQRVRTLVRESLSPGHYQFIWDSKSDNDISLSSGVYFYRLQIPDYSIIRKMILIR